MSFIIAIIIVIVITVNMVIVIAMMIIMMIITITKMTFACRYVDWNLATRGSYTSYKYDPAGQWEWLENTLQTVILVMTVMMSARLH